MADMLQLVCAHHWGLEVAGVEHTGETGFATISRTQPDLVFLDIGLPDIDGITLLPRIRQASPHSKVILISSMFNDYTIGRLSGLPWDGLVDKVADGIPLLGEAIRAVRNGGRYISPTARRLIDRHRQSTNPFSRMLSDREQQVLVCVAHALTDEEIAERLSIDSSTAHSHRKSLLKKLGQHSTPKLMHHAIRHGYGSLPLPFPQPVAPA